MTSLLLLNIQKLFLLPPKPQNVIWSFFPSMSIIKFVILNYITSVEISSHIYASEFDGVKPNKFSDRSWISTHSMNL